MYLGGIRLLFRYLFYNMFGDVAMDQEKTTEKIEVETANTPSAKDFRIIEVSGGATMVVPADMPEFKMKTKLKKWDIIFICAMLFLPIVMMLVFFVYLNFDNIFMAFTSSEVNNTGIAGLLSGDAKFTFDNFIWAINRIFGTTFAQSNGNIPMATADNDLATAVLNSFIFFLVGCVELPFHIIIAYFLFKRICGYRVFQILFYVPGLISAIVVTTMYKKMCSDLFNPFISSLGGQEIGFFTDSAYALWMIILYGIWQCWGGNMMLLGGAMARVPLEVIESARMDGIGPIREIVEMIFPLLWPTVSTLLILHLTGFLTSSGPIMYFCPQGEGNTWTVSYWIFNQMGGVTGSGGSNMAAGGSTVSKEMISATGLVLTAVSVPIIMLLRWLIEKIPVVEY